ncbi:MAG: metal ABC transporter permease [Lachnospiraceae bacterium]|nr:metal ABC transporter permease [Lachnospiraceae bacterium]
MPVLTTLMEYLSRAMVRNALIVGVLIALCASLLGTTIVLKRLSFIGDGLSHVAFGALCVAMVLSISDKMLLVLPVTIIVAVILMSSNDKKKIKGDAAIAMLSVGALAVGYLLMNVFPNKRAGNVSGDVCSTLFGSASILTLSKTDVILCIVLSVVVVLFFIFFYYRVFSITFDENFAAATGIRFKLYRLLLSIIIAVVIVLSMQLVGSLLISALIVFPVLAAERIFRSFLTVVIASAVIGVVCSTVGLIASILLSTPIGATVVCVNIIVFALCALIGKVFGRY